MESEPEYRTFKFLGRLWYMTSTLLRITLKDIFFEFKEGNKNEPPVLINKSFIAYVEPTESEEK